MASGETVRREHKGIMWLSAASRLGYLSSKHQPQLRDVLETPRSYLVVSYHAEIIGIRAESAGVSGCVHITHAFPFWLHGRLEI